MVHGGRNVEWMGSVWMKGCRVGSGWMKGWTVDG